MPRAVAIISTHGRPAALTNALRSVDHQRRLPDRLLVVAECLEDFNQSRACALYHRIEWLTNERTTGLSGSTNTALLHLLETGERPEETFIALLDDDDSWDPEYLGVCLDEAGARDLDWVISGLVRHEPDGREIELSIPKALSPSLFLRGNPNVQGSNLFIRFSKLLEAGLFDENLPSTTDRDLCIRLLDLDDCRYGSIERHLIHHDASKLGRLSSTGSSRKRVGLERFLLKYRPRMSEDDLRGFMDRSKTLFEVDLTSMEVDEPVDPHSGLPEQSHDFQLVIGFIATYLDCVERLVSDITELTKELRPTRVVICDNSRDAAALGRALSVLSNEGIEVKMITAEDICKDAVTGALGAFYVDKGNRQGIPFGRTALHHYLYLESFHLANPVVWILDDDMRLRDQTFEGRRLDGRGISALISHLMDDNVSVAVGGIFGDPPLPVASSIRVQLLELLSNLKAMPADGRARPLGWEDAYRDRLLRDYPDSYYDITVAHFGHLETPFGKLSNDQVENLAEKVKNFRKGHNPFRPALPNVHPSTTMPTRGGNTIVLDIEALRTYPNVAPVVNGLSMRRGDTLWTLLNAYLGGEKMLARTKRIVPIPLFLRQERHDIADTSPILGDKLTSDMRGAAFTRAFDSLMREVTADPERRNPWKGLRFSEEEIERSLDRFAKNLSERRLLISANAWRVRGLVKSIRAAMERIRSNGKPAIGSELASSIEGCIAWIESEHSAEKVRRFSEDLMDYNPAEIERFLITLGENRLSYSTRLPVWVSEREVAVIRRTLETMGISDVRPVAGGAEGLVLAADDKAYKYFYAGRSHFEDNSLAFLKSSLEPSKVPGHIVPLERVIERDGNVVFQMPFINGQSYSGGHLCELLELLRGCRDAGMVMTNIAPDNLKVGENGLVLTDIGRSVKPYSESQFREMCKRAYLCYRWHFRPDLKELMRRALHDERLPELFGFETFLEAVEPSDGREQIEASLVSILARYQGKEVLDYGCREGALSNVIARIGMPVWCYDIDMSRFGKIEHEKSVRTITRTELERRIINDRCFDLVFCCRVLCTVEEGEVDSILSDIHSLTSEDGRVVIAICNPFNLEASWTSTHRKQANESYDRPFSYNKTVSATGRSRLEHHRDVAWYRKRFLRAGLEVERMDESAGIDVERLSPASELLLFTLRPMKRPILQDVSLLIKASAMEWRTIDAQVRHIVGQLEGPESFLEKIVVTDRWVGPFARQYDAPNQDVFFQKLEALVEEGTIDRVLVLDENESPGLNRRWFGIESPACRSSNGQPVHVTLYGLERCRGDYVLQVDSDCLVIRQSRSDRYLKRMVDLMKGDERAITVSMPIRHGGTREFTPEGDKGRWRTEVRCCLLSKQRLQSMLPLGNSVKDGMLALSWHRSLDKAIAELDMHSYRGGDPSTSFIHVPNDRKKNPNEWYNIMQAVEDGRIPSCQYGNVELVGDLSAWLPAREESLVFLVRGRNVPIPLLRRCLRSIEQQSLQDWGLIIIDAASKNGTADFVKEIMTSRFAGKLTLLRNLEPLTPIENIDITIRQLCRNPESIIAMVDSDDALIGEDVASGLMDIYAKGADLSVGSMLRTDKYKAYPVDFSNPRTNRGGNVWQHLRTFKKKLYDRVPQDYLKLDGKWVQHAEDWAFMIPMVELSRMPVHIRNPIYFYQPSPEKKERSVEERERIISEILRKPVLREVGA